MVGRNFWAVRKDEGWQVRQEGLPDATTSHASEEEAWEAANQRARDAHGEAFLDDGSGDVVRQQSYRREPDSLF